MFVSTSFLFFRTDFDVCIQKLLDVGDINRDIELTSRTETTKHSVVLGELEMQFHEELYNKQIQL